MLQLWDWQTKEDYTDNDVYQIVALMNGVWNAKERREALIDLKEKEERVSADIAVNWRCCYSSRQKRKDRNAKRNSTEINWLGRF